MNDHDRYLFDLQGYVTIPNAIDADTVAALNAILDQKIAEETPADATTHRFVNLLDWGQPYIDLLDPPKIVPYLEAILGSRFRLDHTYLDIIRGGLSPIGATLHGGAMPFNPVQYFHYSNGEFHNGLSVVAFNLADVNPGDGGFACVPGSHKSNLPFPDEWKDLTERARHRQARHRAGRHGHHLYRGPNPRPPAVDRRPRATHDLLQVQPQPLGLVGRVPDARRPGWTHRAPAGNTGRPERPLSPARHSLRARR